MLAFSRTLPEVKKRTGEAAILGGRAHHVRARQAMEGTQALMEHAALVQGLRDPAAYPHHAGAIEVIETHISSVLLAGEFAYKLKKPVNLGFVDFSTLERRRHFCEEEIRLNRRGAPSLYLDVVPITGDLAHPRIGGQPDRAIEYAVRMRRFSASARLDTLTRGGGLTRVHIDRLAQSVAAYHGQCQAAPAGSIFGSARLVLQWANDNLETLEAASLAPAETRRVKQLRAWTESQFERCAPEIERRRSSGHVRECHGDLHLGNVVLLHGTPVPFDCIEFNDELRYIDVFNDVAFAFMDLIDHGLAPLAWRFLGAYLDHIGDYEGLATLRFYAVYRALVRAKIAFIRGQQPDTAAAEKTAQGAALARYVKVAQSLARPLAPQLIITCGVTGSGKTTVSQVLLEELGAVRLRSDLERKRLQGVAASDHSGASSAVGGELYGPAVTERTYARLHALARLVLEAGITPIVDATFLEHAQREMFRELASACGVRYTIVECVAPPARLEARITQRLAGGADASDATSQVLAHQLSTREPLSFTERTVALQLDTDTDWARLQSRCTSLARKLRSVAHRQQLGQAVAS